MPKYTASLDELTEADELLHPPTQEEVEMETPPTNSR